MVKEDDIVEEKPKLWLAILVGIALGLVGCVLWELLYFLKYISWIAAFVIVFLIAWGYKKFNLKLEKKDYIIISVIAVVEVLITMFLTLNISIYLVLINSGYDYTFFETTSLMFEVIGADSSLIISCVVDAVLSLVCLVIGVVCYRAYDKRKTQQLEELKKPTDAVDVTPNTPTSDPTKPVEIEKKQAEVNENNPPVSTAGTGNLNNKETKTENQTTETKNQQTDNK